MLLQNCAELSARGYDYMARSADEPDALEHMRDELAEADAETIAAARAKRSGGKLNRSETVTVRLDPQLNYLCELAARAHRRTKSSFIEYAVEQALASVNVPGSCYTIEGMGPILWDVDEPDRLVKLGLEAPTLMTHEEQVIWKIIVNCGWFWRGTYDADGDWTWNGRHPAWDSIRHNWDLIIQVANGEKKTSDLPKAPKKPVATKASAFDDDLDSDVPF
jgi:hypothetical protein